MKIIGGSFGLKGSAYISDDKELVIEGQNESVYLPVQIKTVSANTEKEKKFSIFSFLIGIFIITPILTLSLGIIGFIAGIIIAVIASYYSKKVNVVDINFTDNKEVRLKCTSRGVKKLIEFSPT